MDKYTIRQASREMNVSEMYVRKLIKEGKLESELVTIPGTKIERHEISAESLKAFQERSSNRSSREDGRNKFTVYFTAAEYEQAVAKLSEIEGFDVAELLNRANPPKNS